MLLINASLLVLSLGVTLFFTPLLAAQIGKSNSPLCEFALEGKIEKGDVDRIKQFRQLTPALKFKKGNDSHHICLHSEGGDYEEALRVIKYNTREYGRLSTVIDKGADCFSACAFIFMFGNYSEGNAPGYIARKLHPLGRLGFHSPSIEPGGNNYEREVVAREYRNGIRAIANLLEYDLEDRFPKNLLIEALKIGDAGKFFYVDTVAKVSSSEVELVGFRPPAQLNAQMLELACFSKTYRREFQTMSRWDLIGDQDVRVEVSKAPPRTISFVNRRHRAIFRNFGQEQSGYCVVDAYDSGSKGLFIHVAFTEHINDPRVPKPDHLEAMVKQGGRAGDPIWYAFGPTKRLADIAQ
jgi:hypothetical protein